MSGKGYAMNDTAWEKIDSDHCKAMVHEYFRCEDAFQSFCKHSEYMILKKKNREVSYMAYNAYASFIHHLWEFLQGCHARDAKKKNITNKKGNERIRVIESYVSFHAQRIFDQYRDAIKGGYAPEWVNHISYYEIKVPNEFASEFRKYRNKVSGHVDHERVSNLSLTEFYQKYHKFLYYLFLDAKKMWGTNSAEFPDLKEVTDFCIMITKNA